MTSLTPPSNSEDCIQELIRVQSTICFLEQQGDGKHKEQPVGQEEGNKEGNEGKKMEKEDQQEEGEQKEQPHRASRGGGGRGGAGGEEEGGGGGGEEEVVEQEKEKFRTESAKLKALRFLSILVLVAMVLVVLCSISEPLVLVWRFSFLLCCSSVIWSRRLDVTVSTVIMFLVTFSGFMVALYLDAVVDREIGVLMAHLNSHLAVVMLGYALAKHRQHNGLEVTPATATPPKKLSEKEQNYAFHSLIFSWCYFGTITVVVVARMAWVVCYRAEYGSAYLVLHAFGPMSFALLLWTMFLGVVLLRGVLIGEDRLTFLALLLTSVVLLLPMSYMVLGDIGGMIVTWLGILAWTGCFGYSLCVYHSFKHEPLLQPIHWFHPVYWFR